MSNSKSEDTPCDHVEYKPTGICVKCGWHRALPEPPQDTSLDEPKACLCCNHVLAPLTNGLCFGCKEYLQTQQAKLLQVIEDEVIGRDILMDNGTPVNHTLHNFRDRQRQALKKIKERL